MASWISFSFLQWCLHWIHLSWNVGNRSCWPHLNQWYTCQVIQLFLVTSWLCFSGALPASLVALRVGHMVLFQVDDLILNTMKNAQEPGGITFYCNAQFTAAYAEMNSVPQPSGLHSTLDLSAVSREAAMKLWPWYSVNYGERLQLWFHTASLQLFTFLSTKIGAIHVRSVSVCISFDKF